MITYSDEFPVRSGLVRFKMEGVIVYLEAKKTLNHPWKTLQSINSTIPIRCKMQKAFWVNEANRFFISPLIHANIVVDTGKETMFNNARYFAMYVNSFSEEIKFPTKKEKTEAYDD